MKRLASPRRLSQQGFNLVEILVALTITSIIMGGVVQISAGSSRTNHMTKNFSQVQESGRFAMDILAKDLRMTSYQGCSDFYADTVSDDRIVAESTFFDNYVEDSLVGFEVTSANSTSWADGFASLQDIESTGGSDTTGAVDDSDVISVMHASASSMALTADMTAFTDNLQVGANTLSVGENDLLMITSCVDASCFPRQRRRYCQRHDDDSTWFIHHRWGRLQFQRCLHFPVHPSR